MNEKLNIYDVVRYFVEKSGMLFFYTKEDVKIAYDRICTIINCQKKYFDVSIDNKLIELKKYYDYFVKNFDEYSKVEENKKLFIDIMKLDSDIVFCGTELSFDEYIKNAKNNLKEANSSLFFFQRRYAVREGMRKVDSVFRRIQEYKNAYNLDFEKSELETILNFLNLKSFARENEIINAYNEMLHAEYERIIKDSSINMEELKNINNKFEYIRNILISFYSCDSELEKSTLIEMYEKPLSANSEFYDALNFFKLDFNCKKEEMVETVEKFVDHLANVELVNTVSISNSGAFIGGVPFVNSNKNVDSVVEKANYYKKILYDYFGIEISEEENMDDTLIDDKKLSSDIGVDTENYLSLFSDLFNGLDYVEARKLYFSLMNNFLSNEIKCDNNSKIRALDIYWKSIEVTLKEQNEVKSSKFKK